MSGVSDMKRVKIALTNVNNGGTNVSASVGFFVGDVTGDRAVTASDILAAKGRTGLAIDASTARYDEDLSGTLTTADVDAVKAKAGLSL